MLWNMLKFCCDASRELQSLAHVYNVHGGEVLQRVESRVSLAF